ncbi:hypothetical protein [Sphingomonas sp.]|uniref:hypothetical protein n=1 Tax=Sphingomonas sp. TaxID=28214 RepID=UPI002FDAC86C
MNEGYKSGGTPGGKWGCALAAIVGVPLLGLIILLSAWGDCASDVSCHHDPNWLLILAALATAAVVGFISRALINAAIRRWTNGS